MELLGRRKRARPQRRSMVLVKEDMQRVDVAEQEEDAMDRVRWRKIIH